MAYWLELENLLLDGERIVPSERGFVYLETEDGDVFLIARHKEIFPCQVQKEDYLPLNDRMVSDALKKGIPIYPNFAEKFKHLIEPKIEPKVEPEIASTTEEERSSLYEKEPTTPTSEPPEVKDEDDEQSILFTEKDFLETPQWKIRFRGKKPMIHCVHSNFKNRRVYCQECLNNPSFLPTKSEAYAIKRIFYDEKNNDYTKHLNVNHIIGLVQSKAGSRLKSRLKSKAL